MSPRPYPARAAACAALLALCPGLPAQPAPAPAEATDAIALSPFQVNSQRDRGYSSSSSLGASRVAIPVGDLSSTIITLNEQFLRDRAAVDAPEAITFVSGVQRTSDRYPGLEQFSLRGYVVNGINVRDGLPDLFAAADGPVDESSSYERIEVIKGPAGTLYGTQSLGGVVNKVSKWPRFQRETKVEFTAQSYDEFYRAMVDTTGPLTDKLAYRVVLSARNGNRYYDESDAPNDFYNATASLVYLLGKRGEAGKVWFRGQYLDFSLDRENGWQFITGYLNPAAPTAAPVVNNPKYPLAVDANTVPEDDVSNAQIYGLEAGYERTFHNVLGGDWTLRVVVRDSDGQGDKNPSYAQGRPVPVDANGAIVRYTNAAGALTNGDNRFIGADDPRVADWRATLTLRDFRGYNAARSGFVDLVGDFKTGPLSHKLVLSATANTTETERAFFFWAAPNPANTTAVANSFSAIQKTPAGVTATSIRNSAPRQFNAFNGHAEATGHAFAFQDNISLLGDRLILAVGARRDDVEIVNDRFNPAASIAEDRFVVNPALRTSFDTSANTCKYGLVAKPAAGVSVFAQHSETFTPIASLNTAGRKNPDQDGTNDEIGVKADLWGGRLVATLSYFEMELTNVLVAVPNPPELGGGTVNVPIGVQRTDGWEIDLTAEPLPGLNILFAYSDLTSKDENNRFFRGVPFEANYGFSGRYRWSGGRLKGAFVGASWKHNGRAAGDAGNSFYLPDNDQYDAFLGYEREAWGVQVNIFNLTDDAAVLSAVTDQLAVRAQPRTVRVTFRYRF